MLLGKIEIKAPMRCKGVRLTKANWQLTIYCLSYKAS